MSQTTQTHQTKFKFIALKHDTYEEIRKYGTYGDTMDTIVNRILSAQKKKEEEGELVIS